MRLPFCAALLLGAAACAGAQPELAAPAARIDAPGVERLVDSVFAEGMAREKIPGAAFIMVRGGRVVLSKGYGVSDVRTRRPVSPDSTLWRIGSISKVMTATALVQLADRGRVRLDEDVNRSLKRVQVPATYPQPVTARHLLTHTAGLDELSGRGAASREAVLPLHEFLRTRLVRVRQPGRTIAYSSYGPALSGALVEEVTGQSFDAYLEENVWRPLGMNDTNLTPRGAMATGYEVEGDSVVDAPWEWSNTAPAGMLNSTAADMGRFMVMMLGDHPRGARVLSDAARRSMLTRQASTHPELPGVGLAYQEDRVNGRTVFEHGGDIAGYSTLLVLLPEEDAGFFVATHREGNGLRYDVRKKLIDRLFPARGDAAPAPAARVAAGDLSELAGQYMWNPFCRTCDGTGWRPNPRPLVVNADSTLTYSNQRWVPVGPLLFQAPDGRRLGFARDGGTWLMTMGGTRVMERIGR